MKKKNFLIIFFIAIAVVLLAVVGVISFRHFNSRHDDKIVSSYNDDDITRFEWMEMLGKQFGFTEYENTQPVFSDVDDACEYFKYIQSAVQWKVIEEDELFEGDKIASGYFIALTSMKTIGDYKLQIYLGDTKELSDSDYIDIAIDNQLINKEDLDRGFSKSECEEVIQKILFLANEKFWVDGIENIEYKDGVSEEDVLNMSDGNLGDVIEKAVISEKTTLTFDDIAKFYGWTEENAIRTSAVKCGEKTNEVDFSGFSVEIKYDINTENINVTYTDNRTGNSWEEEIEGAGEDNNVIEQYITASVDFSDIVVGNQTIWDNGLQYQDVNLSYKAEYKTTSVIEKEFEKAIPILPEPIIVGEGKAAGVGIQLYVVFKAGGKIEAAITTTLNPCTGICYENGKGVRPYYTCVDEVEPTVEATCNVGGYVRGEAIPWLCFCPILDFETDIGVEAAGGIFLRPNSQLCSDLSVSLPNIYVYISHDEKFENKTLFSICGISMEEKIYGPDSLVDELTDEKALYLQFGIHFEKYPDGTGKIVKECTWDENKKNEEADDEILNELKNIYTTKASNMPTFSINYSDNWKVSQEEMRGEYEWDILSNDRGVNITYYSSEMGFGSQYYGGNYELNSAHITKVADSALIPGTYNNKDYSSLGKFVVAKIKVYAYDDGQTEEGEIEFDGPTFYTIIPESYLGDASFCGTGYWAVCSWEYARLVAVIAEAPQGGFTQEEEEEVIQILSSFKIN